METFDFKSKKKIKQRGTNFVDNFCLSNVSWVQCKRFFREVLEIRTYIPSKINGADIKFSFFRKMWKQKPLKSDKVCRKMHTLLSVDWIFSLSIAKATNTPSHHKMFRDNAHGQVLLHNYHSYAAFFQTIVLLIYNC